MIVTVHEVRFGHTQVLLTQAFHSLWDFIMGLEV